MPSRQAALTTVLEAFRVAKAVALLNESLQLLDKIRRDYGEDIGLSMLTAWEDEEKWDKATSGFVVNYIRKPFKSEELLSTLKNFFEGREARMVLDTFERHIEKKEEFRKKA